jgi:hypothetical protein
MPTTWASTTLPPLDLRLAAVVAGIIALVAVLLWVAPRLGGGTGLPDLGGRDSAPAVSSVVPPFDPGTTPSFIGVDRAVAIDLLEQLGIEVEIVESPSATARAGAVFQQAPEAGALIAAGDTVTIVVSVGTPDT